MDPQLPLDDGRTEARFFASVLALKIAGQAFDIARGTGSFFIALEQSRVRNYRPPSCSEPKVSACSILTCLPTYHQIAFAFSPDIKALHGDYKQAPKCAELLYGVEERPPVDEYHDCRWLRIRSGIKLPARRSCPSICVLTIG